MTIADIGYDSSFSIEGTTPGTYVAVAEVVSIQPPGRTRDSVEATHLKSPDGYKEFIAGMKDTSEVSLSLNWLPSVTDVLVTAFEANTGKYQITAPGGVRMQFPGFFTGLHPTPTCGG
ncbi:MAG: phage tail tube protein [Cypionkella sp.]|nr:phage tail tube protein [Cypionkella sp.]